MSPESTSLAAACSRVAESVHEDHRLLLFLDFDGTLAPLSGDASAVVLPKRNMEVLNRLSREESVAVTVISGRSLRDLRPRIPMDVIRAGNHGLEIEGRGIAFTDQAARDLSGEMSRLADEIDQRTRHIPGVFVEFKDLTFSVHFRNVAQTHWAETERLVSRVLTSSESCRVRPGNHVIDVVPAKAGNKGLAVRYIRDRLAWPESLTVCIGDDETDEDMFTALPDGLTIRVGAKRTTAAKQRFDSWEEVSVFLYRVAGMISAYDSTRRKKLATQFGKGSDGA